MAQYLTVRELDQLDGNRATSRFNSSQKLAAIQLASAEVDAYIAKVVGLPIDPDKVPLVMKLQVGRMAKYLLFASNGFSLGGDDQVIRDDYDLARAFFLSVMRGQATLGPDMLPPGEDPASVDAFGDGPYVESDEDRGFGGNEV